MANFSEPRTAPGAAWAGRKPMFIPGFDRVTQLEMKFNADIFGSTWLRKTYTNEQTRSIQTCLKAEKPFRRERRLQEVRYGNNISLFFKACYTFRDYHKSGTLWQSVGREYRLSSKLAEFVADLFVKARVIYLNHQPPGARRTSTTATFWVDKWISFIDGRDPHELPCNPNVFEGVDDFFREEETMGHGDLAHMLLTETDVQPPTAPRAMRKRSPSPSALESAPSSKKRTSSATFDWMGPQTTPVDFRGKEEPLDSVLNNRQYANGQPDRRQKQEPYFQLKNRGTYNSPSLQDSNFSEADDYEALARSNMELHARVESLEKERLESARAQTDRYNTIRTLQARFTALEKASTSTESHISVNDKLVQQMQEMTETISAQAKKLQRLEKQLEVNSAAAKSHISVNNKLVRQMQEMTETTSAQAEKLQRLEKQLEVNSAAAESHISVNNKLVRQTQETTEKISSQAEKLQRLEKQLEVNDQTVRGMQETISSLQEDLAKRKQSKGDGSQTQGTQKGVVASQEALKKAFSGSLVRIASLEAKSVLFNDLHKTVRQMKTEIAAQKDKVTAVPLNSGSGPNNDDTTRRLREVEEALQKQDQTVQGVMDKLLILEDQAIKRTARIAALETRPCAAKEINRMWNRITTLDQTQVENHKMLGCQININRISLERTQGDMKDLSRRLATELGGLPIFRNNVCEMQNSIAEIREHGAEVSKRLDDMEVSQETLTLQDPSGRIEELAQSVEALKALPASLAKANAQAEALRAELKAFCQSQTAVNQQQQAKQAAGADDPNVKQVQRLNSRLGMIDWILEKHMAESREKFAQLVDGAACGRGGKEASQVAAVVDSLCRRVAIMEDGFGAMRDVLCARRR